MLWLSGVPEDEISTLPRVATTDRQTLHERTYHRVCQGSARRVRRPTRDTDPIPRRRGPSAMRFGRWDLDSATFVA